MDDMDLAIAYVQAAVRMIIVGSCMGFALLALNLMFG